MALRERESKVSSSMIESGKEELGGLLFYFHVQI